MKIDNNYIKKLLHTVESMESARPYLGDVLESMGLEDVSDEFILHYEVLFDYEFLEAPSGNGYSGEIGIKQSADGMYFWSNIPIRLTAQGHEFIQAMDKSEVWDIVKTEFKESSVKTVFNVATGIAENYAKKKLKSLLGEEI